MAGRARRDIEMYEPTHFTTDPDNPAIAVAYRAYHCEQCHCLHRRSDVEMSHYPWGKAVIAGFERVHEMPEIGCPKLKSD